MARIENHVVRTVVSLPETATLCDAASVMNAHGIGSLGVRKDERLIGLVTEREVMAAIAAGADPVRTPIRERMQPAAAAVAPGATERECAELMRAHHTRHLAVVEDGQMIGLISLLDLVELVVEDKQWAVDQLEAYIRGGRAAQLSQPLTSVFTHAAPGGLAA
jgi:CBS domain-containing protein